MPKFPRTAPSLERIEGQVYSKLAHRLENLRGEVYPFHVGDTWREPPEGCRMENLTVAEYPGMHRYTSPHGMPALLDALVERTRARTGVATERENLLITAGATGGLGAVAGAIVAPGDEVLVLAPHWPLIGGIVSSFHGRPIAVPFLDLMTGEATPEEVTARLDAHAGERAIALYLSTPNNPSGRILPARTLETLVEWASRRDLWILADEVYEDVEFSGSHVWTLPLAPERTFAAHSFSKAYGMAGNRCGYVVGPKAVKSDLRKVSTHTFYSTPTAAQIAALRALGASGDRWLGEARAEYAQIAAAAARRLGLPAPEGSTFLFFDVAPYLDGRALEDLLADLADQGLLLAPGPSFGPYPTHVRLCYTATPPEVTRRGVEILAQHLGK